MWFPKFSFSKPNKKQDSGLRPTPMDRDTGEISVVNTSPLPPTWHPIHQDEARRLAHSGQRFIEWMDAQPVLRPRLVEPTDPRLRERAGHDQLVVPQLAHQQQNTEGIRRLGGARHNPLQRLDSGDLPEFLQKRIPGQPSGALPVMRQRSTPLPGEEPSRKEAKIAENYRHLNEMLVRMPPSLPWGISPPEDAISYYPTAPDLTKTVAQAQEDGWLLSGPTVLDKMDSQELASADKTACTPVEDKEDTIARIEPGLYQLQKLARRIKRESE